MIVDSHCHIYDEKLKDIQLEILHNLKNSNQVVLCCADNLVNSKKCLSLAEKNNNVFAGVGIHPECVETFNQNSIEELKTLLKHKKAVAVGEIGLDYHYDNEIKANLTQMLGENISTEVINKEVEKNHLKQKEILTKQIKLAVSLNLPCVFHVRDCIGDFLNVLRGEFQEEKEIKGVVHSFSGSFEVAQILIKYGLFLGVNGVVTFKNAKNLIEVVKQIPLENLLIETDSPYLTPEPYRGQVNRPEYVKFVAEKIAEIKGIKVEDVIKTTTENAKKLFNLQV